uniref:Uncharacterized protein n=1 Tax=Hemiselmis andersenii TaxID=464988 RepID=A0A6U4IVZ0_HEMAN|mmetsp:Transcript_17008/g.39236  ORF Transcript_17008/g.39236 Transcript_17008/m.39236 type:complete len:351 (+) Transcript_17008:198-1250(+)
MSFANKHPLHVFEGLEGLASNLIARSPKRSKEGSSGGGPGGEGDEHREQQQQLRSNAQSRQARTAATARTTRTDYSFSGRQATGNPLSRPLDKLALLKELTIHSPNITVMQDLYTPHRSYVFGEKPARRAPSAVPWDHADNMRKRDKLIRMLDEKYSTHKVRVHHQRQQQEEASLQAILMRGSTGRNSRASTNHVSRAPSTAKRVGDQSVLSYLLTDADVPNELSGPFRGEDGRVQMPAVKQVSTFEDYLERTVNSVRSSPIRFDDSVKQLDRKQFKPRWMRRGIQTPEPSVDEASMNIVKRAERAATSLGFAPSREVVGMHRQRPPWQVDPSIYVRAGMASVQDEEYAA